ncbi:MAG: CDP-alcohol phosphatidyltransferase family protein, partial [Nitrospirae bacterium]|nr:CDP-alcohol phosphatidyltransferase family protein [Nitrospirota bacterium]
MLSQRFGHSFDLYFAPAAKSLPLSPNAVTVAGFLITVLAALVMQNNLFAGGLLILLAGFFDMLDGIIARVKNIQTRFGALLDSTLDRVSDALILLSAAWIFVESGSLTGIFASAAALIFSFIVSYIRARAEGLGINCTIGLMERPERIVTLAAGCILDQLFAAVVVVAVFSAFTAVQRIMHVR